MKRAPRSQNLTMLERLSLIDNAISRDDENEIKAIVVASPRKSFSQCDFVDLKGEITSMRLVNLIVRLGYVMQFDFFTGLLVEAEIIKDSKRSDKLLKDIRMCAFLSVRAIDSWNQVNDELGLRTDFEEKLSTHLFAIEMLKNKEDYMRKIAFTEDETQTLLIERGRSDSKIQNIEDEVKAIKKALGIPTE